MYFAYTRKPKESTEKEGQRIGGMPGLYRALMTYGIIILVGTIIFYLLALIFVNINNSQSPMLASLIDLLKNLGTILGTALATIIAFYFGMRGSENAAEKAVAATKLAAGKEPPKVLSTSPPDGGKEVAPDSLIMATFSEPMDGSTITKDTFTVKKEGDINPLPGKVSLGPDAKTASFDADPPDFEPNKKYIATIDIGAKDLKGNALASAKTWSFTTGEKAVAAVFEKTNNDNENV
jgi:Bacterial Ig-like domain